MKVDVTDTPVGEQKYQEDNPGMYNDNNGNGLNIGLYVLILGCIWALFELIESILYFF